MTLDSESNRKQVTIPELETPVCRTLADAGPSPHPRPHARLESGGGAVIDSLHVRRVTGVSRLEVFGLNGSNSNAGDVGRCGLVCSC